MRRKNPARHPGFTLVELFVVILVLIVLAVLLFPVASPPRTAARRAACMSNEKQIVTALLLYAADYNDRLPPPGAGSAGLPFLVRPYLKNAHVWRCVDDPDERDAFDGTPGDPSVSYGYNWLGLTRNGTPVRLAEVKDPAWTVAVAESTSYRATPEALLPMGGTGLAYRHPRRDYAPLTVMSVAWVDGHVRLTDRAVLEQMGVVEGNRIPGPGIDAYRYWNRR